MWALLGNLVGPLLGFGAGWVNKWLDAKGEAEKRAHEINMRRVDIEIMQQEAAAKIQVAKSEGEAKVEVAETEAFSEAVKAEARRSSEGVKYTPGQAWLMVVLDFVRGIVRPGLTLYLCVLVTLVYIKASSLAGMMDAATAGEMVKEITAKILFMAEVSTMFWFGTRAKGKN